MAEIKTIPNNPTMDRIVSYVPDVEYRAADGTPLRMQLLLPEKTGKDRRFPLIVFIQGSAWTTPNTYWQIPQLSRFAARGYVVASVSHRSCFEAAAPAFLTDVKSAIRFLRANAAQYRIDTDRVCAWGTSSGGNTALLLAMTGGMPEFEQGEFPDQSSSVRCAVDCFGPTDLPAMVLSQYKDETPGGEAGRLMAALAGGDVSEHMDTLHRISPIDYVSDKKTPPILMLHGDADTVVLYAHSEAFYERMIAHGQDARLIRVAGAPHEGDFWSDRLLEEIQAFLSEKL